MQEMHYWKWCIIVEIYSVIGGYVFTIVDLSFTIIDYDITSVDYIFT